MNIKTIFAVAVVALLIAACVDAYKRGEKGKHSKKKETAAAEAPIGGDVVIEVYHRPEKCDRKTQPGDTISVHYEGKLKDGAMFDSSRARGDPIQFQLGQGQVIPGWEKGLQGMCVGEKRKLTIPPAWGYGEQGYPPVIPPSSTLVFDTELVAIA